MVWEIQMEIHQCGKIRAWEGDGRECKSREGSHVLEKINRKSRIMNSTKAHKEQSVAKRPVQRRSTRHSLLYRSL